MGLLRTASDSALYIPSDLISVVDTRASLPLFPSEECEKKGNPSPAGGEAEQKGPESRLHLTASPLPLPRKVDILDSKYETATRSGAAQSER